jgi:hypothetical protein
MAVTGQQIISVRNGKMRVSVLHVPAGKASDPISKFLHRLCAPLRWWSRSTPQIAVHEMGRTILRILSIPKAISALREGLVASPHIPDAYRANHHLVSMLPHTCKTGMERLENAHRWFGVQDCQTYFQGFREGAECGLSMLDSTRPDKV